MCLETWPPSCVCVLFVLSVPGKEKLLSINYQCLVLSEDLTRNTFICMWLSYYICSIYIWQLTCHFYKTWGSIKCDFICFYMPCEHTALCNISTNKTVVLAVYVISLNLYDTLMITSFLGNYLVFVFACSCHLTFNISREALFCSAPIIYCLPY